MAEDVAGFVVGDPADPETYVGPLVSARQHDRVQAYLQTGVDASLAQQIFGPVDAVVRLNRQRLAYRDREGVPQLASDRADTIRSYGFGVGYHFGGDLRLGFNVDNVRRDSDIAVRSYDGLKYGAALTYGF